MLTLLSVITATVTGVLTGAEFSVSAFMNPVLWRLPAGPAIEATADGGRVLGRVMPVWYIVALLLTAGLSAAAWGTAGGGLLIAAVVLFAAIAVLSVAVLVPINNRSKNWTAEDHPGDWREQQQRWDRLNYVRIAMVAAAFVLTLLAMRGA